MSRRHEEIAEARHNELIAAIFAVVGIVMLGVGFALNSVTRIGWVWFVPYEYRPYHDVAIWLWAVGGILGVIGVIAGSYYSDKRKKLLKKSGEDKVE